jgi:hypothetical protein
VDYINTEEQLRDLVLFACQYCGVINTQFLEMNPMVGAYYSQFISYHEFKCHLHLDPRRKCVRSETTEVRVRGMKSLPQ